MKIAAGVTGYRATFTTVEVFPQAEGGSRLSVQIGREQAELQLTPDEARHLAALLTSEPASVPDDVQ